MKIVQPQFHNPIAETLLITVYMKAIESMKPNRILQDDTSVDIMNHIDYDFKKFENAAKSSVGVCLRAKLFDDLTAQFIESHKNPVIICVGCGLDTRRERLGKRGEKAIFYHLDFPEVIDLREDFIPESMENRYLRGSMLDQDWIETILSENPWGDFLFVIEGVLMYLSEIQVKQFFGNIIEHFVTAELHFDVINKWMSKNTKKHDTLKKMQADFDFGTNDDLLFEHWFSLLKHQKTYLFTDFPEWKRTGIKGMMLNLFPIFRYAGRMLSYRLEK